MEAMMDQPPVRPTPDASLRVLHVISGLGIGGGHRIVMDLIDGLPRAGAVQPALCVLGPENPFFEAGNPVYVPYTGEYRDPRVLLGCARALRAVVRDLQPDLVHTHGWDAQVIGGMATWRLGVPNVVHIHDTRQWLTSDRLQHRMRRGLSRLVLNRDGVSFIAVSRATMDYECRYMGWKTSRVRVIYNGIDVQRFRAPEATTPRRVHRPVILGAAARLAPNKGLDVLIRAVALLKEQGETVRLRIAGEGYARPDLERLAEEEGVAAEVEWVGRIDDMPAFYGGLDVLVLPSLYGEGLPLVPLEAMAVGCPVVVTDVAGTAEAVRDGADGYVVPPGDIDALAARIRDLVSDPDRYARMAEQGRRRVHEQFTVDTMSAAIAQQYQAVLAS